VPPSVPLWRARLEMQWLRVYGTLAQRPRRLQAMDVALMTQRTTVSIDKASRLLGYAPRVDLTQGMLSCERWLRQEGHLPAAPRKLFTQAPPRGAEADVEDWAATSA
jgi:hypothetical protein